MSDQEQQEQHTGYKAPNDPEKVPPLALFYAELDETFAQIVKPISDNLSRALFGNEADRARARAHIKRANKRRPKRLPKRLKRGELIRQKYLPQGLTHAAIAEQEDVSLETIKADYRDMRAEGFL